MQPGICCWPQIIACQREKHALLNGATSVASVAPPNPSHALMLFEARIDSHCRIFLWDWCEQEPRRGSCPQLPLPFPQVLQRSNSIQQWSSWTGGEDGQFCGWGQFYMRNGKMPVLPSFWSWCPSLAAEPWPSDSIDSIDCLSLGWKVLSTHPQLAWKL